jgi:hypothetical protein
LLHAVAVDEERSTRREHSVLAANAQAVVQRPPADRAVYNVEVERLKSKIAVLGQDISALGRYRV